MGRDAQVLKTFSNADEKILAFKIRYNQNKLSEIELTNEVLFP
jgi:hypothetical protein